MSMKSIQPGVSILICTYNGASRLTPTLQALLNQERTASIPWEIVLVDNASTDNTCEVVREIMSGANVPFRLLSEPRPGRDHALRTGFEQVQYEYVCNVDDDTWVCSDYVAQVWEIMPAHPEVAVCGGQGTGEFEVPPPNWLEALQTSLAIGPQGDMEGILGADSQSYLYGACAVYRKSLWDKVQQSGFTFFLSGRKGKKLNSGEDFELCQVWLMAGYKLYYRPQITFKHYMPAGRLTWPYFKKLFRAFGRADLVMQQYLKATGRVKGIRGRCMKTYAGYFFYLTAKVVLSGPKCLYSMLTKNEGNEDLLLLLREQAFWFELLTHRKRFLAVKRAIKAAAWKNAFTT